MIPNTIRNILNSYAIIASEKETLRETKKTTDWSTVLFCLLSV